MKAIRQVVNPTTILPRRRPIAFTRRFVLHEVYGTGNSSLLRRRLQVRNASAKPVPTSSTTLPGGVNHVMHVLPKYLTVARFRSDLKFRISVRVYSSAKGLASFLSLLSNTTSGGCLMRVLLYCYASPDGHLAEFSTSRMLPAARTFNSSQAGYFCLWRHLCNALTEISMIPLRFNIG